MISDNKIPATSAPQTVASGRANKKHSSLCVVVAALAASLVSGCSGYLDPPPPSYVFTNPDIRFPISVTSESVSIDIPIAANKDGMTAQNRRKITAFLSEYRRSGNSELYLAAPEPRSRSPLMRSTIADLWEILAHEGISTSNVRIHDPGIPFASQPWITLTFEKDVATAPPCGIWEHNLADDRQNIPFDNLGCAQNSNLAAMIAYPSDLVEQRAMSDRSNDRRTKMWKSYIDGSLGDKKKKKKGAKKSSTN